MDTHLRVLSESYPINTNMTGFRWFSKIVVFLCCEQISGLKNIERVKLIIYMITRHTDVEINTIQR